jgi:hypothetical protein
MMNHKMERRKNGKEVVSLTGGVNNPLDSVYSSDTTVATAHTTACPRQNAVLSPTKSDEPVLVLTSQPTS